MAKFTPKKKKPRPKKARKTTGRKSNAWRRYAGQVSNAPIPD